MYSARSDLLLIAVLTWLCPCCLAGDASQLHIAAAAGDVARIQALLSRSPGLVNTRDASGYTPLQLAARNLRVEAAERLLDAGADVNVTDSQGISALHSALLAGRDKKEAQAARQSLVTLLLERGADVRATDEQGRTPLHVATVAVAGDKALLDMLLKAGADLAAKDQFGRTPLHSAAMHNHAVMIELMVSKGADVSARDKQGNTPLHCAVLRFRREATKQLIAGGADVGVRNALGKTPLHLAGSEGPSEKEVDQLMTAVAKVLLAHGADVNATDNEGFTTLRYAQAKNRAQLAALLKRHGGVE